MSTSRPDSHLSQGAGSPADPIAAVGSPTGASTSRTRDRAERAEEWFTTPVVVAAVASVPAMFLTTMDGTPERVGSAINVATLVVFMAETLVVLVLSRDRIDWIRRHRFAVGVTLASIPAVIFAVGPVQVLRLLRLVRVFGALRILRVRRIIKAGRVLRVRAGLTGWAWRATFLVLSLASAAFVAFVLADPTSTSRQAIDATIGRFGFLATLLAGALLGGATYVVARSRGSAEDEDDRDPAPTEAADGGNGSGDPQPARPGSSSTGGNG